MLLPSIEIGYILTNLVSFILSDSLGELLLQNDIELERLKSNLNEIHMQLHKLNKSVQIWCGVSPSEKEEGGPELQKRASRADQLVLFFLAGANFWEKHEENYAIMSMAHITYTIAH